MTAIRRPTSRPIIFRRLPPAGATFRAAVLAACLWTPPMYGAQAAQPESPDPAATTVDRALAALARETPNADAEITRLLRSPETADAVLAGLAGFERLPPSLWRGVSTCTTDAYPTATRVAAARLLPHFGSREAATRLIALLGESTGVLEQAARQSLVDLTGLGENWTTEQWQAFGIDSAVWSDRVWTSVVLSRQAARARSLTASRRGLGEEVVALYRRLHVELDAPGRTVLLAELIRDDRAPLRDLGFELAGRDLSARTQLGPEVAAAAAARLSHPDAETRARAATLVSRLVPPDAMVTLTRALRAETDPGAAEPMLLSVARWPNDEAVLPTVQWLERDDAPLGAVTTALWALAHADLLTDPMIRDRVVGTLRRRDPVRGGEPALKLLVRLGTRDDLDRVSAMLASPEDPQRHAAAAALAESPDGAAVLVDAASTDPRLFSAAARAIVNHAPTPEGLRRLSSLPAIDPGVRDTALIELASRLRPGDLASAVRAAGLPATVRAPILARLAEPERERTPGVLDGLLLLAETRLELGRPADAMAVLRSIDGSTLSRSQAEAHARLNRVGAVMSGEHAGQAGADDSALDEWLTAWSWTPAVSSQRRTLAAAILDRFSDRLDGARRAELERAAAGEPEAPAPAAPSEQG